MNKSHSGNEYVFLMGGYDLEMVEIRKILKSNKLHISDKHLTWGAKLSSYRGEFNDTTTFVGIELTRDIDPPANYIEIDHHNENSYKESSLEQVIAFLKNTFGIDIPITRDLELVAANDKGYIPAMTAMGATPDEIEKIRRRDRKAQGVTEEDERLAEKSILENRTLENEITIIRSLTPRFSAITDTLYPCNKLLIYNEDELTYYGEGVSSLFNIYKELFNQKKAYSGGGDNGFFGIVSGSLNAEEINNIKNEIVSILTTK
jgi:hypothetical protein